MPLRVLCVAEKPSVARSLVEILSQVQGASQRRVESQSQYHPVTEITIPAGLQVPNGNSGPVDLLITAVSGHVFSLDFPADYQKWHQTDIDSLFLAPVEQYVGKNNEPLVSNLQTLARNAQQLWLWLDCDREGEAIAQEVVDIAKKVNYSIQPRRAIFNALTREQVLGAIRGLKQLDTNAIQAVKIRSELDLRFGAAFTRFQCSLVTRVGNKTLSYGNCQIPTLKIVVQRYLEHYAFQPCSFWYLELSVSSAENIQVIPDNQQNHQSNQSNDHNNNNNNNNNNDDDDDDDDQDSIQRYVRRSVNPAVTGRRPIIHSPSVGTTFHWNRRRLFDKQCVETLYSNLHGLSLSTQQQHLAQLRQYLQFPNSLPPSPLPSILQSPHLYSLKPITVISCTQTPTSKSRPVPLNTIEFQQFACRKLGLTAHEAMEIAENLYQNGFISYPRTETQVYSHDMEPQLRTSINLFANQPDFGADNITTDIRDLIDYRQFALRLVNDGLYSFPRIGPSNDRAHPPIHPIKLRSPIELPEPKKRKVYDFIVRHFLATCARDAVGIKTKAVLQCDQELFHGEGLVVKQHNFLDITWWERWSNKTIPPLTPGETLPISTARLILKQGSTTGPSLHTESSLIAEMHRNGIGTDATMANHINTIRARGYLFPSSVLPTPLGCALVMAWSFRCSLLASINMRAALENKLTQVANGQLQPQDVLREQISMFRTAYNQISSNLKYKEEIKDILNIALQNPVQVEVMQTILNNSPISNDIHARTTHDSNNNNHNDNSNQHRGSGSARGRSGRRAVRRGDDD